MENNNYEANKRQRGGTTGSCRGDAYHIRSITVSTKAHISIKHRNMKTGIELIEQERAEQIGKHDRQIASDVNLNKSGELRKAAIALIDGHGEGDITGLPLHWTDSICRHMMGKSYVERLAIAGAFCAAEIDRVNFIEAHKSD